MLCYIIRKDSFPHFFYHGSPYSIPPPPHLLPSTKPLSFPCYFIYFFYYYATLLEWASLPNIVRTATLTVFFSLPYYTHTCIILGKKKVKKNLIPNFCCNQCHVTMFSTQWRLQMSFQRWLVFIRNILTIRKVRRNF